MIEIVESNKPFITPERPMVLRKQLRKKNDYIYFYFIARSGFKIIDPPEAWVDQFAINFCLLYFPCGNRCQILQPGQTTHGLILNVPNNSLEKWNNNYSITVEQWKKETIATLGHKSPGNLDIQITPLGLGIGSIIFNHLFLWVKTKYPDLKAINLSRSLSPVDDQDPNNKKRRNRLYEKIGLLGQAERMRDLTPIIESRGFEIFDVDELLKKILPENKDLLSANEALKKEVTCQQRLLDAERERYGKENSNLLLQFFNIGLILISLRVLLDRKISYNRRHP